MPLVCRGDAGLQVARLLAEKRMPELYGHSYAYGSHQDVVEAKYFTQSEMVVSPLQPDTLAKETKLDAKQAQSLWEQLAQSGYIPVGGKPGKSLLDIEKLMTGILKTNTSLVYQKPIENLIVEAIAHSKQISMDEFCKKFLHWKDNDSPLQQDGNSVADLKRTAENIFKSLSSLNFLEDNLLSSILEGQLAKLLLSFRTFDSELLPVLARHLANGLGEHPFDLALYDIDANGNHRLFRVGFTHYAITYDDVNNQIKRLQVEEPGRIGRQMNSIKHDGRGNVIQALHKGIKAIDYHPISQRATTIHIQDGRTVRFAYDFQGERILKKVLDTDGKMTREINYVRDEKGRVLFDRRTSFSMAGSLSVKETIETAYVYGPRGLVGFVRKEKFHNIITDHEGSVRLVVKDGQVVAAYDYFPYGKLMRSFGNDPDTQIAYRYIGQEWDVETGLYNYQTRLYDPDIGRFYQPDPSEQFFSPYKYSGNSPVKLDSEIGVNIDKNTNMRINQEANSRSCGSNHRQLSPGSNCGSLVTSVNSLLHPVNSIRQKRSTATNNVSILLTANKQDNRQILTNYMEEIIYDDEPYFEAVSSSAYRPNSWMDWLTHVFRKASNSLLPNLISKVLPSPTKSENISTDADLDLLNYCPRTAENRDFLIADCNSSKIVIPDNPESIGKITHNDERHGKMSVVVQGERITTTHIPKLDASNFFTALDSWLILACMLPIIYRDIKTLFECLKTMVTNQRQVSVAISHQDKELWRKLLGRLEKCMVQSQLTGGAVDVQWAFPIFEELKQQVARLCQKNSVAFSDAQLVGTMTEKLMALTEDIEEILDIDEEGDVYFDCFE